MNDTGIFRFHPSFLCESFRAQKVQFFLSLLSSLSLYYTYGINQTIIKLFTVK